MESYTISIIGGGNVAFRLSIALQKAGHTIESIYNRDTEKAEQIIRAVKRYKGSPILAKNIGELKQSQIILVCVSDTAIGQIAKQLSHSNSIIAHTSGATDINILENNGIKNAGVFYPLMTLSKNKDIDFKIVPFLIESNNIAINNTLIQLVKSLKAEYKICSSKERLKMHTAAVFATNFVNYMLSLSYDISSPDFVFLLPSVIESVRKAFLNTPAVSQTGPALREDINTIDKHIQYLQENNYPIEKDVYEYLTKKIIDKFATKKDE